MTEFIFTTEKVRVTDRVMYTTDGEVGTTDGVVRTTDRVVRTSDRVNVCNRQSSTYN